MVGASRRFRLGLGTAQTTSLQPLVRARRAVVRATPCRLRFVGTPLVGSPTDQRAPGDIAEARPGYWKGLVCQQGASPRGHLHVSSSGSCEKKEVHPSQKALDFTELGLTFVVSSNDFGDLALRRQHSRRLSCCCATAQQRHMFMLLFMTLCLQSPTTSTG